MEYYQLNKFAKSWITRIILVLFVISYIVVAILIGNLPNEVRFLPANMVETGNVYFQPLEIVATDSNTMVKDNVLVNRFTINTPGRYTFDLIDDDGEQQSVSFRVFIYDRSLNPMILSATLVPMLLFFLSFRGGKYDTI